VDDGEDHAALDILESRNFPQAQAQFAKGQTDVAQIVWCSSTCVPSHSPPKPIAVDLRDLAAATTKRKGRYRSYMISSL